MSVTIPTELCDCGDEPRRGLTARKHMTTCRYGIIEEWESYRPAEAAPPPLDGLREAARLVFENRYSHDLHDLILDMEATRQAAIRDEGETT